MSNDEKVMSNDEKVMNKDDKKPKQPDNIIDFEKEKSPFVHQRKEGKLKKIQQAFKNALPLDKQSLKSKRKPKKKK